MVLESFVGVLAIVFAAIMFSQINTSGAGGAVVGTPFQIFSQGVARGMMAFGVDGTLATVFMTMCVSALALTSVDAVARIGRLSFQEFFAKSNDAAEEAGAGATGAAKFFSNTWVATVLTLALGLALALWRLQQHLAALWRVQPAARRHDDDHARGLLQVHRSQGLHALRSRGVPAGEHLHLARPEHHRLRERALRERRGP